MPYYKHVPENGITLAYFRGYFLVISKRRHLWTPSH